jgi:autotransporter-associated beta strand protein
MGAQMVSNWPYAWVNETEEVYPRHRGTVTGTIRAKTGESTSNAVVILGNTTYTNWLWQGGTNFLFWTTADSNGDFIIPKVRPDTYVLFCYVPGIWGEIHLSNIVVTADQTNNLGVINWNPPHLQQRLWRVGTPDHSSKEFRFGNLPKQYGLWWRYLNEMGGSNLNFIIGQSVESNDWYYAQPEVWTTPQSGTNLTDHTQTNFTAWSPVWNVIFYLTNLPATSVLCTVALAGCNGCYFYPYINGVNQTPNIAGFSNPSQGVFTTSGDDIYRDVVTTGRYQYFQFTFPSSDFVVGTNTFSIHIRQPGTAGTYTITNVSEGYPDLLVGGLIYDFLQMEAGPQVVLQNPPAAPAGLAATGASGCEIDLTWQNTATNATSVVIERSTDGVHFAQINAMANNSTSYADTDLPTGTHYYYEVLANNVDGDSAASNIAQASTQAADPPAAPSGLAAVGFSTNQINLTWINNATDENGFNLERSTNGGNYSVITTLPAGVTNYSDTGLLPATTYYYQVQAFRSCWGNSDYSAAARAATLAPPAPVTPVGLLATPGNTQIVLSWLVSTGAGGYNLKRAAVSGGPYTTIASLTGTSYTNSGLVNGTTYYYVVSAVNAGGEGGNSLEAAATPLAFATAYWTNVLTTAAQSWNANANWTNIASFPSAAAVFVNMTANIAAPQTNNLNQNITLGWLNVGDTDGSSAYMIAPNGGTLTFANGTSNGAGLTQLSTSAGDTVAAPMILSNNLTVVNNSSSHTLTLSGAISGSNSVTYVGPGSVTLTASNGYSGGTLLNGGTVLCAGSTNINQYGFGGGAITFNGGTLQFYGYGGSGGTDWGGCSNTFNVPAGQTGALLLPPRFGYSIPFSSALTGGGVLNVTVDYVRNYFAGNWSAFTGQINASPRGGAGDFRVDNSYGCANAAIYLNSGVNFYNVNANNQTTDIGELGGASGSYLGNGSEQSSDPTWRVGAKNTTNTFAGIIEDSGVTSLIKIGSGSLILTGPNTYSGTTTVSDGTLQIGAGGNTGTLGSGNVVDNAALVFNRYDTVVCSNLVSGVGGLTQAGAGTLTLSSVNTYTGPTSVTAGALALASGGSIANSTNLNLANGAVLDVSAHTAGFTLLNGQTLGGTGSVNGNFTVAGGATLAPGNSAIGQLIFSNSLTLSSGSRTILKLSDNLRTNDTVNVAATLTCGGTLVLTNADTNPLQAGDAFVLFNAASRAGRFGAISLPVVPAGLYCDTNTLGVDGTVRVRVEPSPDISNAGIVGGNLVLGGTGGITNGTYYVLTATNIALPVSNWAVLATNQFDGGANFNFTNTIPGNSPAIFYLLKMP